MTRLETLESIEINLRRCGDLSSSIEASNLTYMIHMAIDEARECVARQRPRSDVSRGLSAGASPIFARVRALKVG